MIYSLSTCFYFESTDKPTFIHYTMLYGNRFYEFPVATSAMQSRVMKWRTVNDRICVFRIRGKFFNYSLINIYAPTNEKSEDDKDVFYALFDKTYGECSKHDVKIILGDANAQVGNESYPYPVVGKESLHPCTNENGLRLVNFAAARGMAICSTFFARKRIRKHTWQHPNGESFSQNDHVLVDGRHFSDVVDVRSFREARKNEPIAEAQEQYNANDKRRFYATVNGVRKKSTPSPVICNDREGNLLTEKAMVAARWKDFQMLLNGGVREIIVENRIDVEDDGIAVESPTLEDVAKAVKMLKNG